MCGGVDDGMAWGEDKNKAGWAIDMSTGRAILTYEGCSVIEEEQAYMVMDALRKYSPAPLPADLAAAVERLENRLDASYMTLMTDDKDDLRTVLAGLRDEQGEAERLGLRCDELWRERNLLHRSAAKDFDEINTLRAANAALTERVEALGECLRLCRQCEYPACKDCPNDKALAVTSGEVKHERD